MSWKSRFFNGLKLINNKCIVPRVCYISIKKREILAESVLTGAVDKYLLFEIFVDVQVSSNRIRNLLIIIYYIIN